MSYGMTTAGGFNINSNSSIAMGEFIVRGLDSRNILKALGITAYDREEEDGRKWTDVAQFERDVRAVLSEKKEKAARKERKAALKRIKALGFGA